MKSVLISIQPKWVEKICHEIGNENGKPIYEKVVEVRKTRPKIETPFKCYIYCTNGTQLVDVRKEKIYLDVNKPFLLTNGKSNNVTCSTPPQVNRKVIGEFVCDKIDEYLCGEYEWGDGDVSLEYRIRSVEGMKTCLEYDEIREYGKEKPLYFWHISDLKIYDKPKELSEFKVECPTKNQINGDCNFCKYMKFSYYGKHPKCNAYLKRPPQSWCYVESGVQCE